MGSMRAAVLVLVAILVPACGSEGGDPFAPGGDPEATLECERQGYPCTLADVQRPVLELSLALADSASRRFAAGVSGAEVLAWIRSQPDVAEALGDRYSVRFRLTDGRPVWVLDEQARASSAGAASDVTATLERSRVVVGEDRASKRALVLAPFAWQFGASDESPKVAAILSGTRGYEGGVQFVENASQESRDVTLSHFTGWDGYDVVHVSSHGKTLCDETDCHAMVTAGRDNRPLDQILADWPGPGVSIGNIGDDGYRYISLDADFFLSHDKNGVGDAIVFINACQNLPPGVTDLADAIRGERGVFLGWSAPVQAGPSGAAAVAFYTHLSEHGSTVGTAYASLGELASNIWTDDDGNTVPGLLRVTERAAGGDLRIREIVELRHPQGGGSLTDNAPIRVLGLPADGQPDTVPWQLRVEGVDGEPGDFVARVTVGDVAGPPVALTAGESTGDMLWQLSGVVGMGRDLVDGEALLITATVELPDQGTSSTSATVIATLDPGVWVGDAGYGRVFGEGDTEDSFVVRDLRFEFDAGRNAYVLTAGTLSWMTQGATFNTQGQVCTFETAFIDFELPPGSAYLEIDPSTSPARYSGYGYFEGPVVDVPTSCPDVTFKRTVEGPWLRADLSAHVLTEDGSQMAGEDFLDYGFLLESWTWLLTLEGGP